VVYLFCIFTLSAVCYILGILSDSLDETGSKLGTLLKLPEGVVESTFQALATSGPEILMAIIAATPFITNKAWNTLELSEKACSGTLNMVFSSMDNLLGIGAIAIIMMIILKKVNPQDLIPKSTSTIIGLIFYIVASGTFSIFVYDSVITFVEGWIMMGIGIAFILSQFIIPQLINKKNDEENQNKEQTPYEWTKEFGINSFKYMFLIFGLILCVQTAMSATFNMAIASIFSVGGILLMFTSFVSSFPEFMLAIQYVRINKKSALLAMLFGSNVIDLAFSGFRSIWLHEQMTVITTGAFPNLLNLYIWTLPIVAILVLLGLITNKLKWKHAYLMSGFYLIYIISGFILL
jgi:Ca2+/Na+ antiporter